MKVNILSYQIEAALIINNKLGWRGQRIVSWLELDNRNLGGGSPNSLIKRGMGDRVIEYIKSQCGIPWSGLEN